MKKKRKSLEGVVRILFLFSVMIIIIASSFSHFLFNKEFYYGEYEKNGVYDVIPENLTKATTLNLFAFFHNKDELRFFSDEERSHLADVKVLIGMMYVLYACAIILGLFCLAYFFKRSYKIKKRLFDYRKIGLEVFSGLKWGSGIVLGLLALLLLCGVLFSFDAVFSAFHRIFFPQGNYSFPNFYPLIVMFPEQFFLDISIGIATMTAVTSIVTFVISLGGSLALSRRKS
ncbi:MAG: DUF1461 domain-containing protein [Nanoarchaeota archaeon]